jgi:putative DNA primase/helicase
VHNPIRTPPTVRPFVEIVNGTAVVPRDVRWQWRGWLARGKFEILAGAIGTGKTTIAINIAATITTGGRWADGSAAEPGSVLLWSGGDQHQLALLSDPRHYRCAAVPTGDPLIAAPMSE